MRTFALDASDLGLRRAGLAELKGGDAADNAAITRRILRGVEQGPMRDAVLLNAAMGLAVPTGDWPAALDRARASLDSGAALLALERLILVSHQ